MKKRILAMLLVLVMSMSLVTPAMAEEAKQTGTVQYVNPIYSDVTSEEAIEIDPAYAPTTFADPEYVTDENIIAEQIREAMVGRIESITVYYRQAGMLDNDFLNHWMELVYEDTDNPVEGDYLRWQIGRIDGGYSYYPGEIIDYNITLYFQYYTTAEQEAVVDSAVDDLLDELNITENMRDIDKVKCIYDWLCDNIEYDYDHLNDNSYKLQFTAYAALIEKTAVCQGYTNLLYRLLREVGINARCIHGTANGGGHAWNIIELDGLYYLADATWDTEYKRVLGRYEYFLKGTEDFDDHAPGEDYITEEFATKYPISTTNYVELPVHTHVMEKTEAFDATCIEEGNIEYFTCTDCNKFYKDEAGQEEISFDETIIAKKEHSFAWIIDKEATEDETGEKHEECTICGFKQNEVTVIDKLPCTDVVKKAVIEFIPDRTCVAVGEEITYEVYLHSGDNKVSNLQFDLEISDNLEFVSNSSEPVIFISDDYTKFSERALRYGSYGLNQIGCISGDVKLLTFKVKALTESEGKVGLNYSADACVPKVELNGTSYEISVKSPSITITAVIESHAWDTDYTIDKEATCTEEGLKSIHCSHCDEVKDITVIEKIDHSYGEWISADAYYHNAVCKCGDTKIESHNIENNSCTKCDYKIAVDATVDGAVDEIPENVEEIIVVNDKNAAESVESVKKETKGIVAAILGADETADNLVKDGVISEETKAAIQEALNSGKAIDTKITVTVEDPSIVDSEVQSVIEEKVAEIFSMIAAVKLFDVSLVLNADGEKLGTINELNEAITITIAIPDNMKFEDVLYTVIRTHDGKTEEIPCENNGDGTVSFETDQFSTYALACGKQNVELMGDVTGDGNIDTSDAQLIFNIFMGITSVENESILKIADVTGDGNVDTSDAQMVFNMFMGII